jgi:alpha-N-arabinofuranosidase
VASAALGNKARIITLTNPDPDAENSLDQPDAVVPRKGELPGIAPVFTCTLTPYSLTTLRIPQN